MTDLLLNLIPFAYLGVALYTARRVFSAMRANEIDSWRSKKFDGEDKVMFGFMATVAGLLWPGAIVIAVVTYKPRKAPKELKAEHDAALKRIAELERELGIR